MKKEIQKVILESLQEFSTQQINLASEASQFEISNCLADNVIQVLELQIANKQDEIDSLWSLLDEIKQTDVKNYSGEFQQMMDRKMTELKVLAATKPAEA